MNRILLRALPPQKQILSVIRSPSNIEWQSVFASTASSNRHNGEGHGDFTGACRLKSPAIQQQQPQPVIRRRRFDVLMMSIDSAFQWRVSSSLRPPTTPFNSCARTVTVASCCFAAAHSTISRRQLHSTAVLEKPVEVPAKRKKMVMLCVL